MNFWLLFCEFLWGAVEVNLFRPLWFTWGGGGGGRMAIGVVYKLEYFIFLAKKTQGKC